MWPGDKFQALFNFPRILCKTDSKKVVSMLIWTDFESFATTNSI